MKTSFTTVLATFSKKTLIPFLVLVLILLAGKVNVLHAQSNFRPAYVVTHAGDTLHGKVDYRNSKFLKLNCRFKDENKNITLFTPDDIAEFRFLNGKYFVSKQWKGQRIFFEYLVKGIINMFYLQENGIDSYFIEREGEGIAELPYDEGTKQHEDKTYFYETKRHMGVLRYYMKDAPGLVPVIERIEKPDLKNLKALSQAYHAEVCLNSPCILYEKEKPGIGLSVEPFVGFVQYNGYEKTEAEFGAYVYLWAPRMNENIYFKTGLSYHEQPQTESSVVAYKIPIQLMYVYTPFKLQPKINGGVNLFVRELQEYTEFTSSLSLNVGLNYVVTKSISLSAWLNTDYTSLSQTLLSSEFNSGLISYSYSLGILFNL